MSSAGTTTNDDEDLPTVENIEQLCHRMSRYDPCFRPSLVQYHLKKFGIKCSDERLMKLFSLSFETMMRSILIDCARINHENANASSTLTSDLLKQTLLNTPSSSSSVSNDLSTENEMETTTNDLADFLS